MVVRLLLPVMGLMCVSAGVLPRDRAPRATVERHVVAMGTSLRLTVTGADRTAALCASEAAVRAATLRAVSFARRTAPDQNRNLSALDDARIEAVALHAQHAHMCKRGVQERVELARSADLKIDLELLALSPPGVDDVVADVHDVQTAGATECIDGAADATKPRKRVEKQHCVVGVLLYIFQPLL